MATHLKEYQHQYYAKNREAINRQRKKWRMKHPEKQRKRMQQFRRTESGRRYFAEKGWAKLQIPIHFEEYQRRFNEQNGKCAICDEPHTRLAVDHCHKTHSIRGLLCKRCNCGLGFFMDNENLLVKALGYLRAHKLLPARQ